MFGRPKPKDQRPPVQSRTEPPLDLAFLRRENMQPAARRDPPRPVETKPMSESYAKALTEFKEMQEALAAAREERDELSIQLQVLQRENARLIAQIEQTEEQRDLFKRRVTEIESRFDDAARVIVHVLDTRMTPRQEVVINTGEGGQLHTEIMKRTGPDTADHGQQGAVRQERQPNDPHSDDDPSQQRR